MKALAHNAAVSRHTPRPIYAEPGWSSPLHRNPQFLIQYSCFVNVEFPQVLIQPGKEGRAAGNLIARLVHAERPDWPQEDRASRDGWELFAAIRCDIDFFKGFRNNRRLRYCPTCLFATQHVINILWLDFEQDAIPIGRSVVIPCPQFIRTESAPQLLKGNDL